MREYDVFIGKTFLCRMPLLLVADVFAGDSCVVVFSETGEPIGFSLSKTSPEAILQAVKSQQYIWQSVVDQILRNATKCCVDCSRELPLARFGKASHVSGRSI